jgi:hypothetical protein
MIPLWISLHVRSVKTNIRLGLPLFLLWLLLLPIGLLLALLGLIACLILRVNPLPRLVAGWGVLSALSGTHVDVAAPNARVFIHVT